MVNRLQEIRDRKDRADEEYSEALRSTADELRRKNPMWTLQTIADAMGLTRQRVSQLLGPGFRHSKTVPVVEVKELPTVNLTCGHCGVTFERQKKVHLYRLKRGTKATYCGSACQRNALGQRQRADTLRTECSKGHAMTQSNTVLVKTTGAGGKAYKGRRCRTCRNTYARNYYRNKRQALQTLKGLNDAMQDVIEEAKADGIRV